MFIWHSKLFLLQLVAFQFFFSCHMSCRMYNQLSSYRSCVVVHGNVSDNWRTIAYNVFWNYSKEEKTILVVLLTQSKTSVASSLQWGKRLQTARFFVNDRHKGLLTVLPLHFPVSKHLYRVVNTFFKSVSFEDDISLTFIQWWNIETLFITHK